MTPNCVVGGSDCDAKAYNKVSRFLIKINMRFEQAVTLRRSYLNREHSAQ